MEITDNRFEYVYCTNCVCGLGLYVHLEYGTTIPKPCQTCYPYDTEDGVQKIKRKNYIELEKDVK